MASAHNGIEYSLLLTAGTILDPGLGKQGSNLRVWLASYVLSAADTAPATLTMLKLPMGVIPIGGFLWATADQGATATFAVGNAGATGKYLAATALHTAMVGGPSGGYSFGTSPFFAYGDSDATGWAHARLAAEETVLVTTASATASAASLFLAMFGLMPGSMGA